MQVPGLSEYCQNILKDYHHPITLIVLAYWAQINIVSSSDAEVELYFLSVLPYITKDEVLLANLVFRHTLNRSIEKNQVSLSQIDTL